MKLIWDNKYSDTEERDDSGRWARVGRLAPKRRGINHSAPIAWIGKSGDGYKLMVLLGIDPIVIETQTLEQAKEICIIEIEKFKENYLI